jgi:hypothetical protein
MRVMTFALLSLIALPLCAQAQTETSRSKEDFSAIFDAVAQARGNSPANPVVVPPVEVRLPGPPNSNAQVQQVIDKAVTGARDTLIMDLDSVLLASAVKSMSGDEDPAGSIKKLLSGLKWIQIRGFELESPGAYRTSVQTIRDALKAPEWARYAAQSSEWSELEIWSARWGNAPMGVLMLSRTNKSVFIVNVAGNLRPDQLLQLSGLLGIPNFQLPLGEK